MSSLDDFFNEEKKKYGGGGSSSSLDEFFRNESMDLGLLPEARPERLQVQRNVQSSAANLANGAQALQRRFPSTTPAAPSATAPASSTPATSAKSRLQKILDTIQYPFDKAAEALAPRGEFLDGKPDEYGATNPRDRLVAQHAEAGRETTGNATLDKIGNFLGETGAFVANPAKVPNISAIYNNPLFRKAGDKVGATIAGDAAGKVATTAKDRFFQIAGRAGNEAVREGLTGAAQGAQYGLTTGTGDVRDVAREAALGGEMGILGGAALGTAGGALRTILDNRAARREILGAVDSAELPLYQNDRIVQQVGDGTIQQQADTLARRFDGKSVDGIGSRVPEAQILQKETPTTARIEKRSNPYLQKYNSLIEEARKESMRPGYEYETLQEMWSRIAGPNDPSLDELIDLAMPTAKQMERRTPTSDMIQKAREQKALKDVYGVPQPVKSVSARNAPKASDLSLPGYSIRDSGDVKTAGERLTHMGQQATPQVTAEPTASGSRGKSRIPQGVQTVGAQLEGTQAMRNGSNTLESASLTARERVSKLASRNDVQTMRASEIPYRSANPDANVKPISRQEMLTNVRKRFNIPVRTGRLGVSDESVLGYYKTNGEVVRTRNHGDMQVISHEIGHHLDKKLNLADQAYDTELMKLGRETSGQGYTPEQVRAEGIAEYIRLYLTDPETALKEAPVFSSTFDSKLNRAERRALKATQDDVARWIDQGPEMQFRGQVSRAAADNDRTIKQKVDGAVTSMLDRLHPLSVTEQAAHMAETGKKGLYSAENSLYKTGRLYGGAPRVAEQYVEGNLKPIFKSLDGTGFTMKDLGDYAAAVHALELEDMGQRAVLEAAEAARAEGKTLTRAQIAKIRSENHIESGFTREQIQSVISKYDTPEMRAAQQALVKYNDELLDYLVQGQVLSADAVQAMRAKYQNYVPFYRFFDSDITSGFGGGGFADLTSPVKRMKGSTRDIIDPLESIVKNTFAAVNAVEKNKVGLQLARLADIEGMGQYVERLGFDVDGKIMPIGGKAPKENIVTVFQNGERVPYQLEPELYRAINELDHESSNTLIKLLSYPSTFLRGGATLTPEFMLRNPIRDQFQSYVVSEFGYKPGIDLIKGMYHVLGKTDVYEQWVKNGGAYGGMLSTDRNYLREQLQSLKDERNPWARRTLAILNPKQWFKLLAKMSEVTEEATKVGEFNRGIKQGYSPQEAAYQSRDLMDFNKSGNSIRQVNRVVTFLNANLQGKDRIARAFAKNPVRSTVRSLTGITIPTIGAFLWNQSQSNDVQRETIENAPQWLRDTFFLISIPGTDVVARIPKPYDLAPVWSAPAENVMREIYNENPQGWGDVVKSSGIDLLKVPYMLTGLTPIIENATNYSFFTGSSIVPRRDADLLPEDQYGVNTSLTARTVGKALGVSPYKVDNLVRGYGAGMGKYATTGTDALLEAAGAGNRPPEESKKISEFPVINAFTVDSTGGGKAIDDFYKALDKATKQQNSNEKNNVVDKEAAMDEKRLSKASQTISKIRKQYRNVQESYDISPDEKRRQLDLLNDKMKETARKALESVK